MDGWRITFLLGMASMCVVGWGDGNVPCTCTRKWDSTKLMGWGGVGMARRGWSHVTHTQRHAWHALDVFQIAKHFLLWFKNITILRAASSMDFNYAKRFGWIASPTVHWQSLRDFSKPNPWFPDIATGFADAARLVEPMPTTNPTICWSHLSVSEIGYLRGMVPHDLHTSERSSRAEPMVSGPTRGSPWKSRGYLKKLFRRSSLLVLLLTPVLANIQLCMPIAHWVGRKYENLELRPQKCNMDTEWYPK